MNRAQRKQDLELMMEQMALERLQKKTIRAGNNNQDPNSAKYANRQGEKKWWQGTYSIRPEEEKPKDFAWMVGAVTSRNFTDKDGIVEFTSTQDGKKHYWIIDLKKETALVYSEENLNYPIKDPSIGMSKFSELLQEMGIISINKEGKGALKQKVTDVEIFTKEEYVRLQNEYKEEEQAKQLAQQKPVPEPEPATATQSEVEEEEFIKITGGGLLGERGGILRKQDSQKPSRETSPSGVDDKVVTKQLKNLAKFIIGEELPQNARLVKFTTTKEGVEYNWELNLKTGGIDIFDENYNPLDSDLNPIVDSKLVANIDAAKTLADEDAAKSAVRKAAIEKADNKKASGFAGFYDLLTKTGVIASGEKAIEAENVGFVLFKEGIEFAKMSEAQNAPTQLPTGSVEQPILANQVEAEETKTQDGEYRGNMWRPGEEVASSDGGKRIVIGGGRGNNGGGNNTIIGGGGYGR